MAELNCFVEAALDVIDELKSEHYTIDMIAITERLGAREPRLSGFNLDCATREALRVAPFARPERTILDDELEELRQQFRESEILDDDELLEETPTGASATAD